MDESCSQQSTKVKVEMLQWKVSVAEAGQGHRTSESHFHQNVDFMYVLVCDDQFLEDQYVMTLQTEFD